MKILLKINNMNSEKDILAIKNSISKNEGIFACQILRDTREVEIVYDESFINKETILEAIENEGYDVV